MIIIPFIVLFCVLRGSVFKWSAHGSGAIEPCMGIMALPFTSHVTLVKWFFNPLVPSFVHVQSGANHSTHHHRVVVLSQIRHRKHVAQCLTH